MKIVLLSCLLFVVGCAGKTDPTIRLTQAGDILSTSQSLLAKAEVNHLIPASDAPLVKKAVLSARALFNSANQHVNDSQFETVMAELQTTLNELVKYRNQYTTKVTPNVNSSPSSPSSIDYPRRSSDSFGLYGDWSFDRETPSRQPCPNYSRGAGSASTDLS